MTIVPLSHPPILALILAPPARRARAACDAAPAPAARSAGSAACVFQGRRPRSIGASAEEILGESRAETSNKNKIPSGNL